MTAAARYQFVRDRARWDGATVALETDTDGNLALARLPAMPGGAPVVLPGPYDLGASGIVAGPCGAVFVSDTEADRVVFLDGLCDARANLRGFKAPRGLALCRDTLWVADSGNARLLRYAFPALEHDATIGGLGVPTGVACDTQGRLYVLDRGTARIRRFLTPDQPDAAYDAAVLANGLIAAPLFLCLDATDRLLASDAAANAVRVLSPDGAALPDIPPPAGGWQPGALAAHGGLIVVADRDSGVLHVCAADGTYWGTLPSFRGPVTALAFDPGSGDLLIKTGLDDAYLRCPAQSAHAMQGAITAGPYDAGEGLEWYRAACQADAPRGTSLAFEIAQFDAPAPPPGPGEWVATPAPDTLLATLLPPGPAPSARRYLWLRATLATRDPSLTPVLRTLRAETPGEDYRDYLPEIYRRADEPGRFLDRFLALARTELAAVGENIDAVPQLLAPGFASASTLGWLAQWLGLELPVIATDAEKRDLIARAAQLYRTRGTPSGIADFVEIYTGVRPSIVEDFATRGLWILDVSSQLDFDTGLPASDPAGMVVPDPSDPLPLPEGCCATEIGSAVVGESGPLLAQDFGEPLFSATAHRFSVYLPAYRAMQPAMLAEARRVIEAEKPAHTGYDLCLVDADMRVGFQARVGIDTIVGGPPDTLRLDSALLGLRGTLPPPLSDAARVSQGARVGYGMQL
ncbi:MAG: hypothetical protein JSR21_04405 [Proteobacteria bacterium]|nr:hypothetical protein [Pseudomonadota bacterium]